MTPRSLPDPTCTNFTVFIRLPFPRDDFVDPPPVEWNASKDQALWDVLSRPSKGDDVDWKALADNLDVTLDFLLQQAAWLYDRQLSKVRAQMRRVGTTHPNTSSPTPGSFWGSNALDGLSPSAEKVALGTGSRAPSRLSMRQKEQPHPVGPQRTNSATSLASVNAATTSRGPRDFSRNTTPTVEETEPNWDTYGRQPEQKPMPEPIHEPPALEEEEEEEEEEEGSSPSESESEDDDDETDRKGPQFKRFGKFSTYRSGLPEDDDEDEDSPAFLPLNREEVPASQEDSGQDLNATLRLNNEPPDMPRRHTTEEQTPQHQTSDQISAPATRKSLTTTTESSASSASSGVAISRSQTEPSRKASQTRGVLSPRRTAELARHSSRRSNTSGRDPSDGTPSMGSSFSDLDDASVSQSALEEALMSNMQHGGVGSRMSTISQALRSRYL